MSRTFVAIDGPVGAGKSTVARALAEALGFTYLDTGAMYRAVAFKVLETAGLDQLGEAVPDLESELARVSCAEVAKKIELVLEGDATLVDGIDISEHLRLPRVSQAASVVAADGQVRKTLVELQQRITETGDWVAEGRDVATVIRPDAELKIFLTASDQERAARRAAQTGRPLEVELADLTERDKRDMNRSESPLKMAEDAQLFDSTGLTQEQVVQQLVQTVKSVK